MNWLAFVSIISAAVAVSFGAIGPALAEGRAVAAAMDAIARQPEAANTISRTLFVGLAMVSIIARPTKSVREMVFADFRLARDGIHGRRNRASFGERRADRAERDRHRGRYDADEANQFMAASFGWRCPERVVLR